jgi:hypothetical protein
MGRYSDWQTWWYPFAKPKWRAFRHTEALTAPTNNELLQLIDMLNKNSNGQP